LGQGQFFGSGTKTLPPDYPHGGRDRERVKSPPVFVLDPYFLVYMRNLN
jgi:hypothetical protein